MNEHRRPTPTPDAVADMAAAVDLRIDQGRAEILQPMVSLIFDLCDSLKAVDLGEISPALTFKCRAREGDQ